MTEANGDEGAAIRCRHQCVHVTVDERRYCADCGALLSIGYGKSRKDLSFPYEHLERMLDEDRKDKGKRK